MNEAIRKRLSTAIYVRVSTEEQAQEGYSIRGQTEKLKSYALLKEWEIFGIYADEGISGKNIVDRPAINRLIEDIEQGNVNNVLVFKVDRLTRSTKNLLELVDLFEQTGCAFNSLSESIDTDTPSGRMFLKIIGIFAEFERENLVTRLKLGFERKAREGYTLGNHFISYGYSKPKGQKIQTIEPQEAVIVKEIFYMYVDENMSMGKIAKTLNERKINTKRSGKTWTANKIKKILTNPTYIGKVRYSLLDKEKYFEADGQHERLLDDKIFHLAQEKLKNTPRISKTKKPHSNSYFCGVLYCGKCGSKYTTHNCSFKKDENGEKHRQISYRCSKKIYYNNDISCKNPNISHTKLEIAFIEYIEKYNDLTENAEANPNEAIEKEENELLQSIIDNEKQLNILEARKKQIMERYVGAEIEFDEYKDMLRVMNERCDALYAELQRKKSKLTNVQSSQAINAEDVILNIKENWEMLNNNEKMIFLQRFVKKISITVEKERKNFNVVRIDSIEFNTQGIEIDEKKKRAKIMPLLR
ncbi:MAG: recombinase family protein [Defluviitaleaceae bacterium]|nr:recombinase family protein [Defluviitaleaceae bacterium]